MGVIAEAMVALVLADAMLEKFGGDSLGEMRRNYDGYVAALGSRWTESGVGSGRADAAPHRAGRACPAAGRAPSASWWRRIAGAPLFDIDRLLVREMGMPVSQIFGMVGEPRFREMERDAVKAAQAAEEPCVIVPGGGWAAQPGQMDGAGSPRLVIYLRCQPAPPRSGAQQGEAGLSWRGWTRTSGCGRCSRNGNRFTGWRIIR